MNGLIVVKYVKSYAQKVHRPWASRKLALNLVSFKNVLGGYLEVTMKYMNSPYRRVNLTHLEDDCLIVLKGFEVAHCVFTTITQ